MGTVALCARLPLLRTGRPCTSLPPQKDDVRDMMVRKIVKMRARLQELGVSTTLRQAATAEEVAHVSAWGSDVQEI